MVFSNNLFTRPLPFDRELLQVLVQHYGTEDLVWAFRANSGQPYYMAQVDIKAEETREIALMGELEPWKGNREDRERRARQRKALLRMCNIGVESGSGNDL